MNGSEIAPPVPAAMVGGAYRLFGRTNSHYTRLARIFAFEAQIVVAFTHSPLTGLEAAAYGGHPALKMPVLQVRGEPVYGAENICRRLAADAPAGLEVLWPETLDHDELRNAQELVWHAMQAQVALVMGVEVAGLAGDNVYFAKIRQGLLGALAWLDARSDGLLPVISGRDISLFEAALYCMFEHFAVRPTVETSGFRRLRTICDRFGERASAQATPYGAQREDRR